MASSSQGFLQSRGTLPSPVELWHRRMFVFSVTATLALAVEIAYAQLVPKIPPLYAAIIRAAVWDCVLVGVLVAQLVDLASTPLLAGTDSGHYLPLAVLVYHAMKLLFCAAYDVLTRSAAGRARSWHRALVSRRVLLELAGGTNGRKLYLGRVCFVVSGGAMWLALRALLFLDDSMMVLTCFIILVLAAYCAGGLAALEPRHSLPGKLVQWLCTGWGAREVFVQGPLKIIGGLFMLPFAASVIAAQIWLRTVAFIVWLAVACPCCRLHRADNVYDAFERELAIPLLQCSFLAFACILAAIVLVSSELSGMQRTLVGISAAYYTSMLMLWTAPTVLQAKVANEEAFDSLALGDEGNATLLEEDRQRVKGDSDIELEDLRSTCDELRALLQRERHNHSIEAGQLQDRLRDQECQTRAAERERAHTSETTTRLSEEVHGWRERCSQLKMELAQCQPRPQLPRLRWPPPPPESEQPTDPQAGGQSAGKDSKSQRSLPGEASAPDANGRLSASSGGSQSSVSSSRTSRSQAEQPQEAKADGSPQRSAGSGDPETVIGESLVGSQEETPACSQGEAAPCSQGEENPDGTETGSPLAVSIPSESSPRPDAEGLTADHNTPEGNPPEITPDCQAASDNCNKTALPTDDQESDGPKEATP